MSPSETPDPRVSVVIPTFNRRDLVCEAIDSAVAQTMPAFEVLVVDDGSTDDSVAHLQARYADEPRVRIIEKSNGGTSSARNRGLEEVAAPFTAFLDSDDLWKPDSLAAQLAVIEREGTDAVLCDADYRGMDRGENQFGDPIWKAPTSLEAMMEGAWGLPTTLLLRSDIAKALGFDETYTYSEDTEFLLRFHLAGHTLCLNPERLADWREHSAGRKNHDIEFGHQLAQMRMLGPHRKHARVRRTLRDMEYAVRRSAAHEMVRAGFWHEARPHLAACVKARPLRPRVVLRWLRSLAARPSAQPLPPDTAHRAAVLQQALDAD